MLRVNGFYGHIQQNHIRSLLMFAGFAIAFQVAAGVLLALPLLFMGELNIIFLSPIEYLKSYGPSVFMASVILFCFRYSTHMKNLRTELNYQPASKLTEPRLVSIVEQHAITAGIPMPDVAIMPETALNAFACGLSKNSATVVVTRGLLDALNDDELGAVIAHEIVHIKNGDMGTMAVANASLGTITMLERRNPVKLQSKKSVVLAILMPPFLMLFLAAGFAMTIATTASRVARLLIASSREYIADAEAVRLTHNPGALISALRKIEGRSTIAGLDMMADAMMIDGDFEGALATHPSISERIETLVQHSGVMVSDLYQATSSVGTAREAVRYSDPSAVAFGQRPDIMPLTRTTAPIGEMPPIKKPAGGLIERVTAGSDKNIFGLTPSVKRGLQIGFMCLIGFQFLMSMQMSSVMNTLKDSEADQKDFTSELAAPRVSPISSKIDSEPRNVKNREPAPKIELNGLRSAKQ